MKHNDALLLLENLRERMANRLTSGEDDALYHAIVLVKQAIH